MSISNTKRHFRRWMLVLFAAVFVPLLMFCFTSRIHRDDALFGEFKTTLLQEQVEGSGPALRFLFADPDEYGLAGAPAFSHYIEKEYLSTGSRIVEKKQALSAIHRSALSDDDAVLYDIIRWNLEKEERLATFLYYDDYFSLQSGVQNQLLSLFAEYPFTDKQTVTGYLTLLSELPAYLESLLAYEEKRAGQGLITQPEKLLAVSEQCRSYAALFRGESNLLTDTFRARIRGCGLFSDKEMTVLEEKNRSIVTASLAPYYDKLADYFGELYQKIEGQTVQTAHYASYYEATAQYEIGTDRSIPQLFAMGMTQLKKDLTILYSLFSQDKSLLDAYANAPFPASEPEEIVSYLRNAMKEDFPPLASLSVRIKEVDPALASYTAPAYYIIPAYGSKSPHTIYINPNTYASTENGRLYSTLAHEGYPGHLYQNAYFLETAPDPCRRLFYTTGYAEGWASYAEQYSYYLSGLPDPLADLFFYDASFSLGIYALCDIGINYYGWSDSETVDFLTQFGLSEENAPGITELVTAEPGNYLPYYFGYLELLDLKQTARQLWGEAYSDCRFHEFFLSFGPAPFPVMRDALMKTE